MTKNQFLEKYPSLNDGGMISDFKLSLLKDWIKIFPDDRLFKDIKLDHNNLLKKEERNKKIETILEFR